MEMPLGQASLFHRRAEAVPWEVTPLPDRLQVYLSTRLSGSDTQVKQLLIERDIDPLITVRQAYGRLQFVLPSSLMVHIVVEKAHPTS